MSVAVQNATNSQLTRLPGGRGRVCWPLQQGRPSVGNSRSKQNRPVCLALHPLPAQQSIPTQEGFRKALYFALEALDRHSPPADLLRPCRQATEGQRQGP